MTATGPLSRYTREERLLGGLNVAGALGMEIGALSRPMLRPPAADIRFVDHADRADLVAKYAADPNVRADDIVPVDAVWGDRTLAECFPGTRFDYVIASHVLEHVPDVIGWLGEIAAVLRPGGWLILAIPDRRYSFDLLRRETSLSELVGNHLQHLRRPSPAQVFDYNANAVAFQHLDAFRSPRAEPAPNHYVTRADALAMAWQSAEGAYIDSHCSVFTARSLLQLLDDLLALGLLPFRLERFHTAAVNAAELSLVLAHEPCAAEWEVARGAIGDLLRQGADSEGLPLDSQPAPTPITEDPRIAVLERAVAELRNSTSWRVTAPIRAVRRRLRVGR